MMPHHRQFLLVNSPRQRYDYYADYKGIRLIEIFDALDIDLSGAVGITVFAPDGFAKSFTLEQIIREYPRSICYPGLDDAVMGTDRGFVTYPDNAIYSGKRTPFTIPDRQFMLLAFERDGREMSISHLDPVSWKIDGEGPFRIVRPQDPSSRPDRGVDYSMGDEYDYDGTCDHNAGDMVRGVAVIRIDPMPGEYEEFDARNAGWSCVEDTIIVIYGCGVTAK
jgi:hypothetical protein